MGGGIQDLESHILYPAWLSRSSEFLAWGKSTTSPVLSLKTGMIASPPFPVLSLKTGMKASPSIPRAVLKDWDDSISIYFPVTQGCMICFLREKSVVILFCFLFLHDEHSAVIDMLAFKQVVCWSVSRERSEENFTLPGVYKKVSPNPCKNLKINRSKEKITCMRISFSNTVEMHLQQYYNFVSRKAQYLDVK